jgi:hypothetical protein
LADWELDADGGVIMAPSDVGYDVDVVLTYRHGYDRPPEPLIQAAIRAAEWSILGDTSNVSPRALGFSNEFGSFRYAMASEEHPTGLPDVDAVLARYSHRHLVL